MDFAPMLHSEQFRAAVCRADAGADGNARLPARELFRFRALDRSRSVVRLSTEIGTLVLTGAHKCR